MNDKQVYVESLETMSEDEVAEMMALRGRVEFGVPNYAWTPWGQKKWHVHVRVDGVLVSHVGILEREVGVGDRAVRVGGLYTVMTAPEWRGRGLATEALGAAVEFIRSEIRAEFGLLLCPDRMLRYYGGLGWRRVEEEVVFEQPGGKTVSALNAMYLPLSGAEWPGGTLDFRGPPW
jgi:GNAT superfamily N-acetyltransferase